MYERTTNPEHILSIKDYTFIGDYRSYRGVPYSYTFPAWYQRNHGTSGSLIYSTLVNLDNAQGLIGLIGIIGLTTLLISKSDCR